MRVNIFPGLIHDTKALTTILLALTLQTASLLACANETKQGSIVAPPAELVLAVHPMTARVNEPRTVFVQQSINAGCGAVKFTLDTSQMESENLVIIDATIESGICGPLMGPPQGAATYRFDAEFTASKAGLLKVLWKGTKFAVPDRWVGTPSEISIQSLPAATPAVASRYDVNGMWFDPATNGSGINLHHRRSTTDSVFGTWFLFPDRGQLPSWLSMQAASWQQDGAVLEGLLYVVEGGCGESAKLIACPATGRFRAQPPTSQFVLAPTRARITFQSATRARAEVLTLSGTVLFTSELTKLQF